MLFRLCLNMAPSIDMYGRARSTSTTSAVLAWKSWGWWVNFFILKRFQARLRFCLLSLIFRRRRRRRYILHNFFGLERSLLKISSLCSSFKLKLRYLLAVSHPLHPLIAPRVMSLAIIWPRQETVPVDTQNKGVSGCSQPSPDQTNMPESEQQKIRKNFPVPPTRRTC